LQFPCLSSFHFILATDLSPLVKGSISARDYPLKSSMNNQEMMKNLSMLHKKWSLLRRTS